MAQYKPTKVGRKKSARPASRKKSTDASTADLIGLVARTYAEIEPKLDSVEIQRGMNHYADQATAGSEIAIQTLLEIADRAMRSLLAVDEGMLSLVAAKHSTWPMPMALHSPALVAQNEAYLSRIKLGANDPQGVRIPVLFKKESPLKRLAYLLYQISFSSGDLHDCRQMAHSYQQLALSQNQEFSPETCSKALSISKYYHLESCSIIRNLNSALRLVGESLNLGRHFDAQDLLAHGEHCASLPPLESDFKMWFDACRRLLRLLTDNEFHLPKYGLTTAGTSREQAKGGARRNFDQPSPSLQRDGILDYMEAALRSVLGIPPETQKKNRES